VEGPNEVVGAPPQGGVLHADLTQAWYGALSVPRHEARARALHFGWAYAALLFAGHLVPARSAQADARAAAQDVTSLSS